MTDEQSKLETEYLKRLMPFMRLAGYAQSVRHAVKHEDGGYMVTSEWIDGLIELADKACEEGEAA